MNRRHFLKIGGLVPLAATPLGLQASSEPRRYHTLLTAYPHEESISLGIPRDAVDVIIRSGMESFYSIYFKEHSTVYVRASGSNDVPITIPRRATGMYVYNPSEKPVIFRVTFNV